MVSSTCLRILIFLPAIVISGCDLSSLAFSMMYSPYKLNKQGDNLHTLRTPFPIWNPSVVPCPLLTVACWSAYSFTGANKVVQYFHLFKNFPQFPVIYTLKSFGVANKAKIDFFFWNSFVFSMIQRMLAIWALVSLPFLNPTWTTASSQFTNCWSLA